MRNVVDELRRRVTVRLTARTADGWPTEPGTFAVRSANWLDGTTGPHLVFGCPRGRGACGVPLQPSPPNAQGCSWQWNGDIAKPTCTPSIDCREENGGCGFHGFMTNGALA